MKFVKKDCMVQKKEFLKHWSNKWQITVFRLCISFLLCVLSVKLSVDLQDFPLFSLIEL